MSEKVDSSSSTMNTWFLHNFVGHPMMAWCYLLGVPSVGDWWHDVTLPKEESSINGKQE